MHKLGTRLAVALCCALLLLFSTVEIALAHKPLFKDRAISSPNSAMPIPDPTISWAIYASLDHPGEADYFSFHANAGFSLDAQITIPAIDSLKAFAPHLALLRPGSSSPPANGVSFPVPAGYGVQLLNATHAGTSDRFDEPFTQTTYWVRQTLKETLASPGTYYLVVFNHPTDVIQLGKYVLAVGEKERFGWQDLLTFPLAYFRVRAFAEAGVPLWGWIVLALLLFFVGGFTWRHHTRRRKQQRETL